MSEHAAHHPSDHEHYDHYNVDRIKRLDRFFGQIDAEMSREIAGEIWGKSVLDVGCGFGSLVDALRTQGFEAKGIDALATWVEAGRLRYTHSDLRTTDGYSFGFEDQSFDTVVLKEAIHHIVAESDTERFFQELNRVCRKRVVVMDPNPNGVLRLMRRIIGHVDPECSVELATEVLTKHGFKVSKVAYSHVFAFPLSGGYIGPDLVPNWRPLQRALIALDRGLTSVLRLLKLDRALCWRYLIVADRT